jgi:hypothetical protein
MGQVADSIHRSTETVQRSYGMVLGEMSEGQKNALQLERDAQEQILRQAERKERTRLAEAQMLQQQELTREQLETSKELAASNRELQESLAQNSDEIKKLSLKQDKEYREGSLDIQREALEIDKAKLAMQWRGMAGATGPNDAEGNLASLTSMLSSVNTLFESNVETLVKGKDDKNAAKARVFDVEKALKAAELWKDSDSELFNNEYQIFADSAASIMALPGTQQGSAMNLAGLQDALFEEQSKFAENSPFRPLLAQVFNMSLGIDEYFNKGKNTAARRIGREGVSPAFKAPKAGESQ